MYSNTGSIEEKAAVDFALARLEGVGRERSMHFDPRWTHEELNWWVGTGGRGTALLEVG